MARSQQTIRLSGGPGNGQVFYVEDWEERRRAAERMGRTADDVRGWALGYRPERPNADVWVWVGPSSSPSGRNADAFAHRPPSRGSRSK